MRVVAVRAHPTSFPASDRGAVRLGVGEAVKRDAVGVKVTTDDGLVGWAGGYFEADVSPDNLFRERLTSEAFQVEPVDDTVRPREGRDWGGGRRGLPHGAPGDRGPGLRALTCKSELDQWS
ncbi:hypothetical protein [Pseudonocardia sp. H11422]|uniref:hypothetical protein n=1 Tax=Pseudonocardia sp. H11422 TaxID=2835866 RepID=UPI001BDC6329|nr:hypothetical protein [Pseudonocardia sp. H11422]